MFKTGLKLWNTNTDSYLIEAQRLFDKGVFDYIELYIVPENTDKIAKWKKLNIPFDIHAPHYAHGFNLSKPECFEGNMLKMQEVKRYADELNAECIVFHGGSGGSHIETARQLNAINDKRALIENKPFATLPFVNEPYYIGSKFEEINFIMEKTKCAFCLDIGHCVCAANSFGVEPYSYIEKFLTLKPKRIHLSDIMIDTQMDEHLHFGKGNLDFAKLANMLPGDICITIETRKESKTNLDDFVLDIDFLKRSKNG